MSKIKAVELKLALNDKGLVAKTQANTKSLRKYGGAVDKVGKNSKKASKEVRQMSTDSDKLNTLLKRTFSAVAVFQFSRALVGAGLQLETMQRTLGFATDDAQESFEYLSELALTYGQSITAIGTSYARLAASTRGTELEAETNAIFKSVIEASTALGLSADDTEGALRALVQMVSKGNVQAEEIRGQFGERMPGAFQMAARAMGVTTKEFNKMLEQGEVLAVDLLPKLSREMSTTFGDTAVKAAEQGRAAINRLSSSWTLFANTIYELGVDDALTSASNNIATNLNRTSLFIKSLQGNLRAQEQLDILNLKRAKKYYVQQIKIAQSDETRLHLRKELARATQELLALEQAQEALKPLAPSNPNADKVNEQVRLKKELETALANVELPEMKSDNPYEAQHQAMFDSYKKLSQLATNAGMADSQMFSNFTSKFATSFSYIGEQAIATQKQLTERAQLLEQQALERYKQIQLDKLRANQDWQSGAQFAMMEYHENAANITQQYQDVFTSGMQSMEDALVQFTTTGKLNFKTLANSIIADMIRIQVRKRLVGLFGSFVGNVRASTTYDTNLFSEQTSMLAEQDANFSGGGYTANAPLIGGVDGKGGFMDIMSPVIDHTQPTSLIRSANNAIAPVNITIATNGEQSVSKRQSQRSDGTTDVEILIDRVDDALGERINNGSGSLYHAINRRQ